MAMISLLMVVAFLFGFSLRAIKHQRPSDQNPNFYTFTMLAPNEQAVKQEIINIRKKALFKAKLP